MADLESVISGAISAAEGGGDAGGAVEAVAADTGADAPVETGDVPEAATDAAPTGEASAEGSAAVSPTSADAAPEPADGGLSAEMEALGLKAIAGKDNRIPYSRVVKILENARKQHGDKLAAEHRAALEAESKRYQEAQQRLQQYSVLDQNIANNPDWYIAELARHLPAYQKYLAPQEQPKPAQSTMPAPDVKFADGSPGYSSEQSQKLFDWIGQQAEERAFKRAEAAYAQRIGPLEQQHKAQQYLQQQQSQIRQEVAELHEVWGEKLVEAHKDDIIKYREEHPNTSLRVAAGHVLRPKLEADRNRQREEILKELEARPKAAAPTPAAPAKTAVKEGARTMEDIIRESIAAVKR